MRGQGLNFRGTRLVVVVLRWAWWSYTTVGTATVAGETCVRKKIQKCPIIRLKKN